MLLLVPQMPPTCIITTLVAASLLLWWHSSLNLQTSRERAQHTWLPSPHIGIGHVLQVPIPIVGDSCGFWELCKCCGPMEGAPVSTELDERKRERKLQAWLFQGGGIMLVRSYAPAMKGSISLRSNGYGGQR